MKKAVWTLVVLMIIFHQLQIGVGLENGNLILVKDSLIVLCLVVFILTMKSDSENNFFLHLATSSKIALLASLLYAPLNFIASFRYDGNLHESIGNLLMYLPKLISSFIISTIALIPLVAIASLISFFVLLSKKRTKLQAEDHFISDEDL